MERFVEERRNLDTGASDRVVEGEWQRSNKVASCDTMAILRHRLFPRTMASQHSQQLGHNNSIHTRMLSSPRSTIPSSHPRPAISNVPSPIPSISSIQERPHHGDRDRMFQNIGQWLDPHEPEAKTIEPPTSRLDPPHIPGLSRSTIEKKKRPRVYHYDDTTSSSPPKSSRVLTQPQARPGMSTCSAKRCSVVDCGKIAVSKGLCRGHGGGRRCTYAGCTKCAQSRSPFCWAHGGGKRCEAPNCRRSRKNKRFCVDHLEGDTSTVIATDSDEGQSGNGWKGSDTESVVSLTDARNVSTVPHLPRLGDVLKRMTASHSNVMHPHASTFIMTPARDLHPRRDNIWKTDQALS